MGDDASPVLKQVDVKLLELGLKQFALRANKETSTGRMDGLVLRRVKRLIDVIQDLISVIPKVGFFKPSLSYLARTIPLVAFLRK